MVRYRQKIPEVTAVRFTNENFEELLKFGGKAFLSFPSEDAVIVDSGGILGKIILNLGDYLIKYPNRAFATYSEREFLNTYEEV